MSNPFEMKRIRRSNSGATERLIVVLVLAAAFVAGTVALSVRDNGMAKCEQNFSRATCIYNLR